MPDRNERWGLLVEDVGAMRAYLKAALMESDIEIAEAESLAQARAHLEARAGRAPCFVSLDLELPDGNGLDLMPAIPSTTRVIALTADCRRETQLRCKRAGCETLLAKNHELSTLREVVLGALNTMPGEGPRNLGACESYVGFLAETRVEIETARSRSDFLALRQLTHRLRGTAVHFGFPGIGAGANSVSAALAAGKFDQLDAAVLALIARIGDAIQTHHARARNSLDLEVSTCES